MWHEIMQQAVETQEVFQGEVNLWDKPHENKHNVMGFGMKSDLKKMTVLYLK